MCVIRTFGCALKVWKTLITAHMYYKSEGFSNSLASFAQKHINIYVTILYLCLQLHVTMHTLSSVSDQTQDATTRP